MEEWSSLENVSGVGSSSPLETFGVTLVRTKSDRQKELVASRLPGLSLEVRLKVEKNVEQKVNKRWSRQQGSRWNVKLEKKM